MSNFLTHQEQAKKLNPKKVSKDFYDYLIKIKQEFIQLNIEQLEKQKDAKGRKLENANSDKYSGLYTKTTEIIAKKENPLAPKKAGQPYNFLYHGDFLKSFDLYQKTGEIDIFSTGTGSGQKAEFFDGYKELFGLTDENLKKVIDKSLLPFLLNYYKKNLFE